jgi:uncharacterized protein YigE (DUF2233 family)
MYRAGSFFVSCGEPGGRRFIVCIYDARHDELRLTRFFRDKLQCPDALYFDGTVSSTWIPSRHRLDHANPLGPMVLVLRK